MGELLFQDRPPSELPRVDLFRVKWTYEPQSEGDWTRQETIVIDLRRDEDELFGEMAKGTRYEARRADTKDGVSAEAFHAPTPELVDEFADHYDDFARTKSLTPMFRPRLHAMADCGALVLTRARRGEEPSLAWHAYAASEGRGVLIYSASQLRRDDDGATRNLIGRANRYLHWRDIVEFKARGYELYDLGGLDLEGRSEETTRIARFKQGFGGVVRPMYSSTTPATAKGQVVAKALRLTGTSF